MSPARVLLVDDNAAFLDNTAEILASAGYEPLRAGTCAEARRRAERGFDVALVDFRLPDGEGTRLASDLKAIAAGTEVILLTGFATLESAIAAVRAGVWAYLIKPCAPSDLLLAVEQAMRHVRLADEKRRLDERARFSEKLAAIGTMAASLAHEIRNPLNAARLQLEVAERRLAGPAEAGTGAARAAIVLVRSELSRLNRIVEDILDYARPRDLVLAEHDLAAEVRTVVEFLAPDAAAGGIRLTARGVEGPLPVRHDAARVRQVLINLIRNGAEAAGHEGEVSVHVAPAGDYAEVVVEDTGPGIPDGVDPFEPFVTTKQRGSGLGLATAQRIVHEHGGTIEFSRPGGRTRCTVLVPRQGPPEAAARVAR